MSPTSFRSRLLVGSVLWTIGVLLVVSVLLIWLLGLHPGLHARTYAQFRSTPAVVTFTLGLAGMTVGLLTIRRGLAAVDRLRATLVAGEFPAEIQPLVDDLNALVVDREQRVDRAIARAGDLAHGLKTPLAVLARDADRAVTRGEHDLAVSMHEQIERMRQQIDHHLVHARAAAAINVPGLRAEVDASVRALVRTMARLHADKALSFDVAVVPLLEARMRREDLDELLGNLLDNACKWARSSVRVSATCDAGMAVVAVEDDGEGLDAAHAAIVVQRGVRADERTPGWGLGLSIVNDLIELCGGSLTLSRRALGGLWVEVRVPAADARRP
jgi:signal transduction histidine kinase